MERLCDGKLERLVGYFSEDEATTQEVERWAREINQSLQRGIQPIASKILVVPLFSRKQQEKIVVADVLIHQKMFYKQGDQTYRQENHRLQTVQLKPDKYGWTFIRPWGWFLKQAEQEVKSQGENSAKSNTTAEATPGETVSSDNEATPVNAVPSDEEAILVDGVPRDDDAIEAARKRPHYNRTKAVEYAETYWNHPNPAYQTFEVDCTNFVSQCLHAGGIPMTATTNRGKGWWYSGNSWSWSWSVAHALYLLLKSGNAPFYAKQVDSPDKLQIGDVICYDFDGDGHWQHNTFVVAKDGNGMPLVNARTYDSQHRYWEYRDSTAYTPNIQYAFFHIYGRKPE